MLREDEAIIHETYEKRKRWQKNEKRDKHCAKPSFFPFVLFITVIFEKTAFVCNLHTFPPALRIKQAQFNYLV